MKGSTFKLFLATPKNSGSDHWKASSHYGDLVVRHYSLKEAIILVGIEFANATEYRVGSDIVLNPWALGEIVEWAEIPFSELYANHWEGQEPAILSKDCVGGFCEHCNESDLANQDESLLYFRKMMERTTMDLYEIQKIMSEASKMKTWVTIRFRNSIFEFSARPYYRNGDDPGWLSEISNKLTEEQLEQHGLVLNDANCAIVPFELIDFVEHLN